LACAYGEWSLIFFVAGIDDVSEGILGGSSCLFLFEDDDSGRGKVGFFTVAGVDIVFTIAGHRRSLYKRAESGYEG
jgi:hypothetical protein